MSAVGGKESGKNIVGCQKCIDVCRGHRATLCCAVLCYAVLIPVVGRVFFSLHPRVRAVSLVER